MRKLNKFIRYPIYFIFGIFILIGGFIAYVSIFAISTPPTPLNITVLEQQVTINDTNFYVLGNNWLRKSNSGLWEMYVEGEAFERGVINGKLSKNLIHEQEVAFSEQIFKLVPSPFYRNFLKYLIAFFNRNLDENITEEYKLEIYGVSKSASTEFNYIGTPYQRMMNYHAAHDIGHALQNLALVGCSSFATWDKKSENNRLIIGRNFDFYVGDKFAENKIVMFMKPEKGIPFMMVTWGGMTGVVSGMNMQGLTITLNAAKSEVPTGSATPISILAREILQYAGTIDEAVTIAKKRKTFVSESFLIGSAKDHKAVSIEITPNEVSIFDPQQNYIVCTNHYQSKELGNSESNKQQMNESASVYREERIKELLSATTENNPEKTVAILRDQLGKQNKFIGYGNEKTINQLISHHSIVFEPERLLVWVSSNPWQLGAFMAYDLNKIFSMKGLENNHELYDSIYTISPDTFLMSTDYKKFVEFRNLKEKMLTDEVADPNKLIALNPEYYHAYVVAGDYSFRKKQYSDAQSYYENALTKEIATKTEENYIREQLQKCRDKI